MKTAEYYIQNAIVVFRENIDEAFSFNYPAGLYFSNRGCYYPWIANLQFCYHIQSEWKQSWYGARQTCDSYLGNLVSIGSQEEYDFLEEAFRNKEVSSCLHIGLQNSTGSSEPSWVDGNVWSFSKLNSSYELVNVTDACVFREVDGLWYFSKCSEECGFVCKRYRGKKVLHEGLNKPFQNL